MLSLILGTIVGLAQTRIKRLLAYSTISHIGFILLALAISTEQSIESLIFYIIQYSITNLNTFLILIALSYLIYNSVLQKIYVKIIKNNYYFLLYNSLSNSLQIKYNILNISFFPALLILGLPKGKAEGLLSINFKGWVRSQSTEYIISKNSLFIK